MLWFLGALTLGGLLSGGRHRALRRGLLLGALFGYLANRNQDANRVKEDARTKAREAERKAREAARTARKEFREARRAAHDLQVAEHAEAVHEKIAARKAERDQRIEERLNAIHAEIEARKARREQRKEVPARTVLAVPASAKHESEEILDLVDELERDARTAAMAAPVPTIEFPEEDGRYHSARKYGYA